MPGEARETPSVWTWIERHVAGNGPIRRVEVVDVRQSMANGGGPACLRLRVVADPSTVDPRFLLDEGKLDAISDVIRRHWPEQIRHDDLQHAAMIADIERALGFYVGVLGFKEQQRFPIGDGVFEAVLGLPDSPGAGLLLMWNTRRSEPYRLGDGYSRLVINVSDLDAAVAHLERHATPIVSAPRQAGAFYYALAKDPDGYVIELLQVKRG